VEPASADQARRGAAPRRLSSQLVAWSLVLFLLVQAAVYAAVSRATTQSAQRTLDAELQVAERVWQRLLEQRAARLQQAAAVLAADYGFRDAVTSGDADTVRSALENHGARIDASLVALLDTRFALRHAVGSTREAALAQAVSAAAPQLAGGRGASIALVDGRALQIVAVPVRAPALIGSVLMGFEIDHRVVQDLHQLTGLQASLRLQRPGAAAARTLHTSLSGAAGPADAPDAPDAPAPLDPQTRTLDSPLAEADGERLSLRLAGSLTAALDPFRQLLLVLAVLTAAGAAMFGAASLWTARRVTRPLGDLVRASERLAAGDYAAPLPGAPRRDEVGELALAFEQMRQGIAARESEIRHLAYWDRLTGLPNRLQFRDAVQAELAAGAPLAVITLDLDRFKHVNDVLGYALGDRLLQALAGRLAGAVRPGDLVARLSGDEFALLVRGAGEAEARASAGAVMRALADPLSLDDQRVDLGAGLGIALAPQHAADADTLLSRAEVAMYAAKRSTEGLHVYDAANDNASVQTLSLLSELREAVERGELRLFLQPKVRVADGALSGAEALVRWQHPTRGLVPPMQFIPFAEQTGFVRRLTLWVFEEAARAQAELRALGMARVAVNLSTRDLMDLELPAKLDVLLARHGALAEGFVLEITESAIMDDPARAEATLNRLAGRGFKLAIDDFGTGYSSLAYLRRLPVQELKIDKGFVMAMPTSEGDAKIVRSTIDLAHNLGLSVVAEGVESAAILEQLRTLGCDEAQGYHLGRPAPLAALRERLTAQAAEAGQAAPEALLPA